jgi:hypothetical protein
LPKFQFYRFQAGAAEAVIVLAGDEGLFFVAHRDAIALTFEDIARFAFERDLAAATMFGFVLAHTVNIRIIPLRAQGPAPA